MILNIIGRQPDISFVTLHTMLSAMLSVKSAMLSAMLSAILSVMLSAKYLRDERQNIMKTPYVHLYVKYLSIYKETLL